MPRPVLQPFFGVRYIGVINVDGEHTGPDGTSHSLSNHNDRELLVSARRLTSLIVTDAVTAAKESYRASRYAPIEIWSKSGNFRNHIPESQVDSHPIKFVTVKDLELEGDRISGENTLLESGPTLAAALARFIGQAVITVADVDGLPGGISQAAAVNHLHRLGLTELAELEWFEDDRNGYLVANRRG